MWGSKFLSGRRGVALVTALLISSLLFLLAFVLGRSLSTYLKMTAAVREKTQTYYTTVAGLEEAKDYLWNHNCYPPAWCGLLGNTAVPSDAGYQDKTRTITGRDAPDFTPSTAYRIYLKDNEDNDASAASDNDQIILASIQADDRGTATRTVIEAMLILNTVNDYAQSGGGVAKRNHVKGKGPRTVHQRQALN